MANLHIAKLFRANLSEAHLNGADFSMAHFRETILANVGVPADFSREDIIAAFRRKALQCHPDHGGTEAQFIELVKARDRLLASIGTRAAAPKMPEFAPRG